MLDPTFQILTTPVISWLDGTGLTLDVAPQPAMVSSCPATGRAVPRARGRTSVTGADSLARAMSVALDCRTSTTARTSPGEVLTLEVFRVADVGYGTGPLTLYAGIHLALNAPNAVYQESVRAYLRVTYPNLVTEIVTVEGGHILAPTGAGIGTTLLPEVRERPDTTIVASTL